MWAVVNVFDNWTGHKRVFPHCVCMCVGGWPQACITGYVDVSMLDLRLRYVSASTRVYWF